MCLRSFQTHLKDIRFSCRAMLRILQSVYQRSLEWRHDISVPEVGMKSGEHPRIREKSQEACLPHGHRIRSFGVLPGWGLLIALGRLAHLW